MLETGAPLAQGPEPVVPEVTDVLALDVVLVVIVLGVVLGVVLEVIVLDVDPTVFVPAGGEIL